MNSEKPVSQESESLNLLESLRVRFHHELREGGQPDLEEYWKEAGESASEDFLRALILLELESRSSSDETVSLAILFDRYRNLPISATAIQDVFEEWQNPASTREGKNDESAFLKTKLSKPVYTIDRYEIREELGKGSFGTVYRAWDPKLEREVALKVPHEHLVANQEIRERYLREARAVSAVRHPGICPLYEIHERDNQSLLLSLAFIKGETLASYLRRHAPLTNTRAATICAHIAEAVHQAHQRGVLHRDLKPQNVLISVEDNQPVVTDFGLARRTNSEDVTLTQDGLIVGTPAYMSPEQASGGGEKLGVETDVYSLGVMLFEMLTAQRPFVGKTLNLLSQIINEEPTHPTVLNSGVDPELEEVCLKAMSKQPADRFSNMEEFASALRAYVQKKTASETIHASQLERKRDLRRPSNPLIRQLVDRIKSPYWLATGLVLIAGVWGILGFAYRGDHRSDAPEKTLNQPAKQQKKVSETVVPPSPISKVVGQWRIFSDFLPQEHGLLEIYEDGRAELILSEKVESKSSQFLPSLGPDWIHAASGMFLTALAPADEKVPTDKPAMIPAFDSESREKRIRMRCEVVPQDKKEPVSVRGTLIPDAETLHLSFHNQIVEGDETFPVTSLSLYQEEIWKLVATDADHMFGERIRVQTFYGRDGSTKSLNISFDGMTMIRDSAYRGNALRPHHWLLRRSWYMRGQNGEHVELIFLPEGQLFLQTESKELYGGRQSTGYVGLTYRLLDSSEDSVKIEIRRKRDQQKELHNIPLAIGPPRETWTCREMSISGNSSFDSSMEVARDWKVIEIRTRLKKVIEIVDGKKVPTEVEETYGVEVPVSTKFVLNSNPNQNTKSEE